MLSRINLFTCARKYKLYKVLISNRCIIPKRRPVTGKMENLFLDETRIQNMVSLSYSRCEPWSVMMMRGASIRMRIIKAQRSYLLSLISILLEQEVFDSPTSFLASSPVFLFGGSCSLSNSLSHHMSRLPARKISIHVCISYIMRRIRIKKEEWLNNVGNNIDIPI